MCTSLPERGINFESGLIIDVLCDGERGKGKEIVHPAAAPFEDPAELVFYLLRVAALHDPSFEDDLEIILTHETSSAGRSSLPSRIPVSNSRLFPDCVDVEFLDERDEVRPDPVIPETPCGHFRYRLLL